MQEAMDDQQDGTEKERSSPSFSCLCALPTGGVFPGRMHLRASIHHSTSKDKTDGRTADRVNPG
jgi:hypothetical protein